MVVLIGHRTVRIKPGAIFTATITGGSFNWSHRIVRITPGADFLKKKSLNLVHVLIGYILFRKMGIDFHR
jgi:hypothetical protein